MKPHQRRFSGVDEIMQLTLERGEWIQVCFNIGTREEPRYEIVELVHAEDGEIRLNGNIPSKPWPVRVPDEGGGR